VKAYTESSTPTEDKDEQATPFWFYRRVQEVMGVVFDVDVCASRENHKAFVYWTKADNCLNMMRWRAPDQNYFWMNPPYSMLEDFTATAHERSRREGIIVVGLVPHMSSSQWFQKYVHNQCATVWVLDGRISFELNGVERASNPLPSCCPIWTPWRSDTSYVYFDRNKPARGPKRTRERTVGQPYL
jgi:phage N-6-adenine-methyltransferase